MRQGNQWSRQETKINQSKLKVGTLAYEVHKGYVEYFQRKTGKTPPPVVRHMIEDPIGLIKMLTTWLGKRD